MEASPKHLSSFRRLLAYNQAQKSENIWSKVMT